MISNNQFFEANYTDFFNFTRLNEVIIVIKRYYLITLIISLIMKPKYQPINCHFYDELELLAIRQQRCLIQYHNEAEKVVEKMDIIMDFKIIEKAEFMILKSGEKIRLDKLVSVDGKVLKGFC